MITENKPKIIAIGECLVDMMISCDGKKVRTAGGAPANVSSCVTRLGGLSYFLGKLSSDDNGKFLLKSLKSCNIQTDYVIIDDTAPTAVATVTHDKSGDRTFEFFRDNTADLMLREDEIDDNLLQKGDILHFCSVCLVPSFAKQSHIKAIKLAKQAGSIISFDVNIRENLWSSQDLMIKTIHEFLPFSDIIKVTEEELKLLVCTDKPLDGVKKLFTLAPDAKLIFVTKGANGASIYTRSLDAVHRDALPVTVVDTTGAGDCFSGSSLFWISQNGMPSETKALAELLDFAICASNVVVTRLGSLQSMPTLDEIENFSKYTKLISEPVFFERNRVFRIYLGGKQFSTLCGDEAEDTLFPEEWIASPIKAINPKYFGPRDGVSVIKDTNIFFDDLLSHAKKDMLGNRKFDCLVKYLDSAIRLPVQVHPTKDFSRKHFNSNYGKTEAWLVIDTRENEKIYFGFNKKITKEEFSELEERSLEERDIMSTVLQETIPKVGDLFLINAGLIHAIGAGCTIIEIQEPTDFTIQPENWCGDYHITEQEKYIGLSKSTALDCFDYSLIGQSAVDNARITPSLLLDTADMKKECLVSYNHTDCFSMNRYTLSGGSFIMEYAPCVYIILEGSAKILGECYEKEVSKGDYFFLPYSCESRFSIKGNATIIECLPSKQD